MYKSQNKKQRESQRKISFNFKMYGKEKWQRIGLNINFFGFHSIKNILTDVCAKTKTYKFGIHFPSV